MWSRLSLAPETVNQREGSRETASSGKSEHWAGFLAGILLVAAVLRFLGIAWPDLWVDEANTWRIARAPLSELPALLANDSSPPLYYIVLHAWMGVLGDGVVALRASSALLGVGLVAAVFILGRSLDSARTGLWSAWVVATSPVQIFYSQQVRMYALLPLLSLLALMSLLRLLERRDRASVLLCAVTTAAALYTHNFALYLLPVLAAVAVFAPSLRENAARVGLALGLALLLWAPWWSVFHAQLSAPDTYSWFASRFESWDPLMPIRSTLHSYSPLGPYIEYAGLRQLKGLVAAASLSTILAVLGVVALRHRRTAVTAAWVPLLCWLLVPPALALTASRFVAPHYVPGRVDQMMFPAFAILVGAGLAALPSRPLRLVLGAAFLVLGVLAGDHYHVPEDELGLDGDQAGLARAIREQARAPTAILCTSLSRAPLEHALRRSEELALHSYPRSTADHLGGQDDAGLRAEPDALRSEAAAVLQQVRDQLGAGGTLLLVLEDSPVNEVLREQLARWELAREERVIGRYRQRGTGAVATLVAYELGPGP